jgi:hypothetical protein
MNNALHISCASLVKCSARQICFYRHNKKEKAVTPMMNDGQTFAERSTDSKYVEMRGTYKYGEILMHYAVDEIRVEGKTATFIEHKYLAPNIQVKLWFFELSVLQTALYNALALENKKKHNTKFVTASFYPGTKQKLDLKNHKIVSFLNFGGNYFIVSSTKTKTLVDFYTEKAKASLDYNLAAEFDSKYKHKEYGHLKKYIKIGGLEPIEKIITL